MKFFPFIIVTAIVLSFVGFCVGGLTKILEDESDVYLTGLLFSGGFFSVLLIIVIDSIYEIKEKVCDS